MAHNNDSGQSSDIENRIIHDTIKHPRLQRGKVWCRTCGKEQDVDPAVCMKNGWPKCCGHTMTVDSPEEQARG